MTVGRYTCMTDGQIHYEPSSFNSWQPIFAGSLSSTLGPKSGTVKIKEWWVHAFIKPEYAPITGDVSIGVRAGRCSEPLSVTDSNVSSILRLDKADYYNSVTMAGDRMRWQRTNYYYAGTGVMEEGCETHYINAWHGRYHWIAPLGQEIVLRPTSYWRIEINIPSPVYTNAGVVWEEATR